MEQKKHFTGLTDEQVRENREKYGENVLVPPPKKPLWKQYLENFKDPIIRILLVALILSFGVSFFQVYKELESYSVFLEPLGILIAILLATGVAFAFTVSANRKFDILNKVNDDTLVKVIRNGNISTIPKREIVVGDIIVLETGDEIPADGQLLEAISLQVNESTLTGEPSTHKTTNEAHFNKDATYPSNMVYRGTTVLDGHGIVEVQSVGNATQAGEVETKSQTAKEIKTPLDIQLNKLATLVSRISYMIAVVIIVGRLLLYFVDAGNINWINASGYILNTVMIAVTVIVVAVPEGLPMAVTLSLAMSMKRMLSTNNLVRKLHACETMGAVTVICTDKTGTLTQNQMKVFETNFYNTSDNELRNDDFSKLIQESISINSTAYLDYSDSKKAKVLGNPTEGALLLWLHDRNINYLDLRERAAVLEQLTFSTERKYMATLAKSPLLGKKLLYVKGAPEIVLSLCKKVLVDGKEIDSQNYYPKIEQQLLKYQQQAMRTLGFAYQVIDDGNHDCFKDGRIVNTNLTFLGIVAISDPVRTDVPQAVQECRDAGINVKIVTGDTPGTAKEIGRQIGLWLDTDTDRNHLTGAEFAEASDETLLDRILDLKILSRARPLDKERLVKLLQKKNQVVAVTGDGTNDAPALNAAQVGLSMGDGTSVAKEASDITILDNSFSSISRAVMWGRSLYQNIQRFIVFQMTINVAACLIVMIGAFLGRESPLTVTQMLWVNIIMDTFAALALASLPPNEEVMKDKPRKTNEHIVTPKMGRNIVGIGAAFVLFLFGLMQYFKYADITGLADFSISGYFANYFNFSEIENGFSPYELSLFFTIFVMLQFWNMFNAKAFNTGRTAFYRIGRCLSGFVLVAFIILAGQYLIVTFGGEMFSVVPLKMLDWGIIIAATSVVLWIGEIIRLFSHKNR